MNSTFYINAFEENIAAQLLIECSNMHLAFTTLQNNKFTALASYHINDESDVDAILQTEPVLQNTFTRVDVVFANKVCVLVPPAFYNSNQLSSYLELLYGNIIDAEIKADFLFRHNIHAVYAINKIILGKIKSKFSLVNISHKYALMPDVVGIKGNKLHVQFYQNKLVILCCKENNLQLIQQYDYTTAEDVAYYLLAIIEQHGLMADDCIIELGGTIDEKSVLYAELHKYFLNLYFMQLPQNFSYTDELKTMPPQYFSPLFTLLSCV